MRIVLGFLLPMFMFGQSYGLKTLIDNANNKNGLIEAKTIKIKSAQESVDAAESAYWPTVDVGASGSQVSPNNVVSPGQTTTAYAAASMNLYDGGRKSALLSGKEFEYDAAVFEKSAFEKSITLEIVRQYYGIQTRKATLAALQERSTELRAQIHRVEKFKTAGLSTQEDVDQLQSVYAGNDYIIANTKLALVTSEQHLKLLSGLPVKYLKKNTFAEPKNVKFEIFENIKMLEARANAVGETSKAIKSGYQPQVNVSDTYHQSHFDDTVSMAGFDGSGLLIDNQNKVMVSVDMRLFDRGRMSKESEAVRYQKLSLLSEIEYAKKEQKMNFHLSQKSLEATRSQLKSVLSEIKAANSTYSAFKQKFEAGLVDNIAFLDTLARKTLAQARYKETLYNYEINKSIYYYYAGKNPKEFIR